MSHFALLWKARAIERYRKNYEQEKMHSIMLANAKPPNRTLMQRIRHVRYNCKKRVIKFLTSCCPKGSGLANFFVYLKTDQTFPNFILKSIIGFVGGFVLTYMFFLFFVFQLTISLTHATVMCSVIGVMLTLGLAFSYRVRCLVFLLIPQFFSEVGRYTLMGYALILILTGPAKNTLQNSEVLSESMACGQEQLKDGVRQIQESIAKPFNSMKDTIRLMVHSVKEVATKIKETLMAINRMVLSIVRVIQSAFTWLSSIVSICNKKLGAPSQRCFTALEDGVLDCRARLGPYFAWLCSVAYVGNVACYAAKALDVMCVLVDFVSGTVVATVKRKLRTFSNHIQTMLFVSVHIHHSYSFSSNSSRSASQVAAGIVTEIRHRADRLLQWFSWMSCITSLFLLLIIFRAKYYQHMYETRSRYDNRYVTRELRELDLRRAREDRDTVLPLNRRERAKYVTTTSFRLVASEKLSMTRSVIFMSITTFKLLVHMVADYSLYWVLVTIRRHGRFETPPQPAAPDGGVVVSGEGPLAAMLRGLVSALTAPLTARPLASPVSCLPDPSPPDTQRYMQIGILILLLWTFAIFEPYGLRLRHAVMAHYRPERARARAVWLYNHILRTRGGFLKIARRKLHRSYKLQPEDKLTFRQWLDSVIPCWWLRSLLATKGRGVRCLLCSVAENENEPDSKLVKCETAGCVGVYCVSCFNDIGRLCTICLSPADYGDISDISLEKGSSESDTDTATNTTYAESEVEKEDFEKASEWQSTDDNGDDDSSPKRLDDNITRKQGRFMRKRNKDRDKRDTSSDNNKKDNTWGRFFNRKKRVTDSKEESEKLLKDDTRISKPVTDKSILKKRKKRRNSTKSSIDKPVIPYNLDEPKINESDIKLDIGVTIPNEEVTDIVQDKLEIDGIDAEKIAEASEKLRDKVEKKAKKKVRSSKKIILNETNVVAEENVVDKAEVLKEGTENVSNEKLLLNDEKGAVNVENAKVYYCVTKTKCKSKPYCIQNKCDYLHYNDNTYEDRDRNSDYIYDQQTCDYDWTNKQTNSIPCIKCRNTCCRKKSAYNTNKYEYEQFNHKQSSYDISDEIKRNSVCCDGDCETPLPRRGMKFHKTKKNNLIDDKYLDKIKEIVIDELKREGSSEQEKLSTSCKHQSEKPYWKEGPSNYDHRTDGSLEDFRNCDCPCHEPIGNSGAADNSIRKESRSFNKWDDTDPCYLIKKERDKYMKKLEKEKNSKVENMYVDKDCDSQSNDSSADSTETDGKWVKNIPAPKVATKKIQSTISQSKPNILKIKIRDRDAQTEINMTDIECSSSRIPKNFDRKSIKDECCPKANIYKTVYNAETCKDKTKKRRKRPNKKKNMDTKSQRKCRKVPKRRCFFIRRKTNKRNDKQDACVPCEQNSTKMKVIVFENKLSCDSQEVCVNTANSCYSEQLGRSVNFEVYPERLSDSSERMEESTNSLHRAPIYKINSKKKSSIFKFKQSLNGILNKPKYRSQTCGFQVEYPVLSGRDTICKNCYLVHRTSSVSVLCKNLHKSERSHLKKIKRKFRVRFHRNYSVYSTRVSTQYRPIKKKREVKTQYAKSKDWYAEIYAREMGFDPPDQTTSMDELAGAYDNLLQQNVENEQKIEKKNVSVQKPGRSARSLWVRRYEWPAAIPTPRCLCPQEICTCGLRKPPDVEDEEDPFDTDPQPIKPPLSLRKRWRRCVAPLSGLFRCSKKPALTVTPASTRLLGKLDRVLMQERKKYEEMEQRGDPFDTTPTACLARCHKYYEKVTKQLVDDRALNYRYQDDPDAAHELRNDLRLQRMINYKNNEKRLAARQGLNKISQSDEASLQDFKDEVCSDGRTPVGSTQTTVAAEDSPGEGARIVMTPICSRKACRKRPGRHTSEVRFVNSERDIAGNSASASGINPKAGTCFGVSSLNRDDRVNVEVLDPDEARTSELPEMNWVDYDSVKSGAASIVKKLGRRVVTPVLRWAGLVEPPAPERCVDSSDEDHIEDNELRDMALSVSESRVTDCQTRIEKTKSPRSVHRASSPMVLSKKVSAAVTSESIKSNKETHSPIDNSKPWRYGRRRTSRNDEFSGISHASSTPVDSWAERAICEENTRKSRFWARRYNYDTDVTKPDKGKTKKDYKHVRKDCAHKAILGKENHICVQCQDSQNGEVDETDFVNNVTKETPQNCDSYEESEENMCKHYAIEPPVDVNISSCVQCSENGEEIYKASLKEKPKRKYTPHNADPSYKCLCKKCRTQFRQFNNQHKSLKPIAIKMGPATKPGYKDLENFPISQRVKYINTHLGKHNRNAEKRDPSPIFETDRSDIEVESKDANGMIDREGRNREIEMEIRDEIEEPHWRRKKRPHWPRTRNEKRRLERIESIIPPPLEQERCMSQHDWNREPRNSHVLATEMELLAMTLDIAEKGTSTLRSKGRPTSKVDRTYRDVTVRRECEKTPFTSKRSAACAINLMRKEEGTSPLDGDKFMNIDMSTETRLSMPTDGGVIYDGKYFGSDKLRDLGMRESRADSKPPSVETLSPEAYTMMSTSPNEYDYYSGLRDLQHKFEPVKTSSPSKDAVKTSNVILSKDASPILPNYNCGFFEMMHDSTPSLQKNSVSKRKVTKDTIHIASFTDSLRSGPFSERSVDGTRRDSTQYSQMKLSDVEAMGQRSSTESRQEQAVEKCGSTRSSHKGKTVDATKTTRRRRPRRRLNDSVFYSFFKKNASKFLKADQTSAADVFRQQMSDA